jgi:hypothetical protein
LKPFKQKNMPTNLEDWTKPAHDSKKLAEKLTSHLSKDGSSPYDKESERVNMPMSKMPSYIGTKIVCATPMTEIDFLTKIKGTEVGDRENMNGYLVVYEDGYKSWSPKETFERAYRLITPEERKLI